MAQPNFTAATNHLQGIQNEDALVPNIPALAGLDSLRHEMNANLLQVIRLRQMQGQLGEIQNKYLRLPHLASWHDLPVN